MRSFRLWRLLLIGAGLALLLRLLLVQVYGVASDSMQPTLTTGDRIAVWKLARVTGIERGDVVVLDGGGSFAEDTSGWWPTLWSAIGVETLDSRLFVKRVVALGGDRLKCCDAEGRLLLNGEPLIEPYLLGVAADAEFDIEVPIGRMWVMGDNRAESLDSLDLLGRPGGGMIDVDRVVGRVGAILWPPARMQAVD